MKPTDIKDLLYWLEDNFDCLEGPRRAYFNVPTSKTDVIRFTYTTYALSTRRKEGAEEFLVQALFEDFEKLLAYDMPRTLFWRLPEHIELDLSEEATYCDFVGSDPDVKDGRVLLPLNAVQEFETLNWYQSAIPYNLYRIYTRICFAGLQWEAAPPLMTSKKLKGQRTLELI